MYFAYFDESGDSGFVNSPTNTFTLSALLIHDKDWLSALDQTIAFRRYLRDQFHISPRAELKASWLVHNKGDIKASGLSYPARMAAYKAAMRFQRKAKVFKAFTLVVVKDRLLDKSKDVRDIAWRFAIQRLERFGSANSENIHILPDEGHGDFIRRKIRALRRFSYVPSAFGNGTKLKRNAVNIVEDSSDRRSTESFFVQLADLNAYAGFRNVFPGNNFGVDVWDELGDARVKEVNKLTGGPVGIVVYPRQ